MAGWWRRTRKRIRDMLRKLVTLNGDPHGIALGFAMGLTLSVIPTFSIGMFTALQVKGVPSRFLHFPDEGHWVLQPANAQVWYREVLGWMMKYIG